MSNLPADICNQALDACGIDFSIGDMQEGSKPAQVLLRAYGQCLRQLLRSAHWDAARAQEPLVLLGDATGNTPNVGTLVQEPWIYAYQYPIDCMKLRFIPWNYTQVPGTPTGNIAIPTTIPLTGATGIPNYVGRQLRPSRFLIGNDPNYPSQSGQIFWETQGQAPTGSTVIMSNVKQAIGVYTRFMPYPSTWDPLFRAAFVAFLAAEIALPLAKMSVVGPKGAMALRKENIEIAKAKIKAARVTDGNEMGFANSDISVDWMQTRRTGGWGSRGGWGGGMDDGGAGCYFNSWDAVSIGGSSAF